MRKPKKYYYIYHIINLINRKYYVGAHGTNNLEDNYFGSGWALQSAIKKYGKENFKKEILYFCLNEKEMFRLEEKIVTNEFLKEENVYNLVTGGSGGYISDTVYQKLSRIYTGRPLSEETKKKLSDAAKRRPQRDISDEKNPMYGKPSPNRGKHFSDEIKKYISERVKEAMRRPDVLEKLKKNNSGKNNPMYGKPGTTAGKHRVWNEDHTKFHYE